MLGLLIWGCDGGSGSAPSPVRVAVASNFLGPMRIIAARFEERTGGVKVALSAGSTGKLFAQIESGAPFDVFLAADVERPALLERKGLAVPGSRFTYAVGRLALYGPAVRGDAGLESLRGHVRHVAIANPDTAPYGIAARQVLERAGLWASLSERVVRGENIAQTHQFVDSGGAEVGFVALSSVVQGASHPYWAVPAELHEPIRQGAVLLRRSNAHARARELLDFLRGPEARSVIEKAGYGVEGR